MKNIKTYLVGNWRSLSVCSVGLALVVGLLIHRLYRLAPGFSGLELQSLMSTGSLKVILLSPVYLPFKLSEYAVLKFGYDGVLAARMVSVGFALLCVGLFFSLLRQWYTARIAALGTLLFVSSSWFLHVGRSAIPYILFPLCTLLILYLATRVQQKYQPKRTLLIAASVGLICAYVPGMLVLVGGLIIWQRHTIWSFIKTTPLWLRAVCALIFLAGLLPAGYGIYYNTGLVKEFLSIPNSFQWLDRLKQLVAVPYQLFIYGSENPGLWLAKLPILDVFSMGMAGLGLFVYYRQRQAPRTQVLAKILIALTLIIGLTSLPVYAVLPIVYIVVVAGINLLLQQWFTVFPRNPLARWLGLGVVSLAVLFSCWYHISRYFVAWGGSPVTKASFTTQTRR